MGDGGIMGDCGIDIGGDGIDEDVKSKAWLRGEVVGHYWNYV